MENASKKHFGTENINQLARRTLSRDLEDEVG